jgi:hypothetical protein
VDDPARNDRARGDTIAAASTAATPWRRHSRRGPPAFDPISKTELFARIQKDK